MLLLVAVLSAFAVAPLAASVQRRAPRSGGWFLALLPLGIFLFFLAQSGPVLSGQELVMEYPWVPSLGVTMALRLDGLSLLFSLLVSGIGALVVLYSGYYLRGDPYKGRFQAYTLIFMGAMLGLVLADDAITMFVFWELTSVSSYLLIGFYHEEERARYGALKALLVTSVGGLALLLGLVMLGQVGGSLRLSQLLAQGEELRAHALYLPILILVLWGAFAKSAQVPFHIWLPDAMQAPTPASCYLHSATMVKAGVYLLARLQPALGGTELWHWCLGLTGLLTMVVGAYLAFKQTDLKALLAYSTVSSLGSMVALVGLGTSLALKAALVTVLAHALYKAALFLVVGMVDHEAGTRDLRQLGGLARHMPATAALAIVAGLSLAGIPPLFGFLAKEALLESLLLPGPGIPAWLAVACGTFAATMTLGYAILIVRDVFFGPLQPTPKSPHEAPVGMLLAPATLVALSVVLAFPPARDAASTLLAAAASASLGKKVELKLALWHGLNLPLLLSLCAVGMGAVLYALRRAVWQWQAGWPARLRVDPLYDMGLAGMNRLAAALTRSLQTGALRHYLLIIMGTLLALEALNLVISGALPWPALLVDGVAAYEVVAAALMVTAALAVVAMPTRLGAIAALGTVGFLVALFYVVYSGPDLALTQLLVETLTVILLLLVFHFLPQLFREHSHPLTRLRDAAISVSVGILITALVLSSVFTELSPSISGYYLEQSLPAALGANVVNVIVVDFRALDTLGEISVLTIAGLGAYGLIKLRPSRQESGEG